MYNDTTYNFNITFNITPYLCITTATNTEVADNVPLISILTTSTTQFSIRAWRLTHIAYNAGALPAFKYIAISYK